MSETGDLAIMQGLLTRPSDKLVWQVYRALLGALVSCAQHGSKRALQEAASLVTRFRDFCASPKAAHPATLQYLCSQLRQLLHSSGGTQDAPLEWGGGGQQGPGGWGTLCLAM